MNVIRKSIDIINSSLGSNIKQLIRPFAFNATDVLVKFCPLQRKIVASSFKGRKYTDNPKYIVEKIHELDPSIDIVWICDPSYNIELPPYVRRVQWYDSIALRYELGTAKVWIDSHRIRNFYKKRKGQLFMETWHGGIGMKKLELDVPAFREKPGFIEEVQKTTSLADVFISQSDYRTRIYRSAFEYHGPVWKCGFPKNDIILQDSTPIKRSIYSRYDLPASTRVMLYAPSFRDYFYDGVDVSVYNVDFTALHKALVDRFGGEWKILVHWHPLFADQIKASMSIDENVIDVTDYSDMQQLLLAADALLSDYSSCMFDATITRIPCFTFATDFELYKADRGTYFEMEDLPFPYAQNNEQLIQNVISFDEDTYKLKLDKFFREQGLHETGHATIDIANNIISFINGENIDWSKLD